MIKGVHRMVFVFFGTEELIQVAWIRDLPVKISTPICHTLADKGIIENKRDGVR